MEAEEPAGSCCRLRCSTEAEGTFKIYVWRLVADLLTACRVKQAGANHQQLESECRALSYESFYRLQAWQKDDPVVGF